MQTYGFDMTHRPDPDLHVVLEGSFCTRAISSRRMVYDIQCYELFYCYYYSAIAVLVFIISSFIMAICLPCGRGVCATFNFLTAL